MFFDGLKRALPFSAASPCAEVSHSDSSVLAELPSDLPKELSLVLAARQGQQHLVEALLANRVDVPWSPIFGTVGLEGVCVCVM